MASRCMIWWKAGTWCTTSLINTRNWACGFWKYISFLVWILLMKYWTYSNFKQSNVHSHLCLFVQVLTKWDAADGWWFVSPLILSADGGRWTTKLVNPWESVMFEPTGGKPNQRFACFYDFHGVKGVGWGGLITFICTTSHTWCYATVSLLALPHIHDATLLYVFLHYLTYMMLRYCKSSCTSAHIMMLRYCTSSCTSAHTWCYATVSLLALPHIHDATLLHVFLHFLTYMMLRYFTSSCTSSHTWCYATVSLLALPHIHNATLL